MATISDLREDLEKLKKEKRQILTNLRKIDKQTKREGDGEDEDESRK